MAAAGSGAEATVEKEKEETGAAAGDGKVAAAVVVVAAAGGGGGGSAGGGESDEEEDVFEVERILDMKTEAGKTLYKVRWKGYSSDDDTWEPEAHLEDCKEVLLEFRRKNVDNKPKPVKDVQRLSLNDDVFEAESDSDWQSEMRDDMSPKKKKKKSKDGEDRSQDELKKKKFKPMKVKEKPRLEHENSSDSLVLDSKPKKRTSESREDLKDPKKQRREDSKEINKKKGEVKDFKKKLKEDSKESKKLRKEKHGDLQIDSESSALDDSFSQAADNENMDSSSESKEEKRKVKSGKTKSEQETGQKDSNDRQPDGSASTEEDSVEVKVKRKKKKLKKIKDYKEDSRKIKTKDSYLKKTKKLKGQEKMKASTDLDKGPPTPALLQKCLRLSTDERGRKSTDSAGEVSSVKKLKSKEVKSDKYCSRDLSQTPSISDCKERNINRKDEYKMKESSPVQSVVGTLFEKFSLNSEHNKGGSTVGKKSASKNDLNAEDIPKERGTLSKVIFRS
uniref:M-phase phosphoprotein 8 n=1 Tax=Sphenodon punctatus TaxID=8508 RepID=A0A8D0GNG4_SPHPU